MVVLSGKRESEKQKNNQHRHTPDRITLKIAEGSGAFAPERESSFNPMENGDFGRFDRMGPESPELPYSARHFTYRFSEKGEAEEVAFNISAFSKEEARELAQKLRNGMVGCTNTTYRYRVFHDGKYTDVQNQL